MKLEELAKAVGISPRTVRYYVQRGLVPAPVFRGRDTEYDEEHELRLRAIRKLQDSFLPLDAIQAEIEHKSLAELRAIADGKRVPALPRVLPAPVGEPRWQRWRLARGLELHLADDADDDVKELAEELRRRSRR